MTTLFIRGSVLRSVSAVSAVEPHSKISEHLERSGEQTSSPTRGILTVRTTMWRQQLLARRDQTPALIHPALVGNCTGRNHFGC